MHLLSPGLRTRRKGEWSSGKAVIFIVTLGATRSVTLAARSAGMSRKSAYALKGRDPAFAQAWNAAVAARHRNEVEEVEATPVSLNQGDRTTRAGQPTSSSISARIRPAPRRHAELDSASMNSAESTLRREHLRRDRFFARLAAHSPGQ